jgi:hypothetical protein
MTTIRSCAGRLLELLDKVGDDVLAEEAAINEVMQELLALPGLDTISANPVRDASHGGLGWLYYDGDLRIVRGSMPAGMHLAPHNHGSWNLFGVYRGAVRYESYRRLDDGTIPYYAELEPADHRTLRDGDTTVMPGPPHDIHGVLGLAPLSVTVLVARGFFSPAREQYFPERNAYLVFEGDGLDAVKG